MDTNSTCLYNWHKARGKITTFENWQLPREFTSTKEEHLAVRRKAGLFDISHMGRILVSGEKSTPFLKHLLTRNPENTSSGEGKYALACNENGGVKDDLVIFRLERDEYLLVCNSSTREKILRWLKSLRNMISSFTEKEEEKIKIKDETFSTSLFAIQGPNAEVLTEKISEKTPPENRFEFKKSKVAERDAILSRTGYTGEDGFEILALEIGNEDEKKAEELWTSILKNGEEQGIKPCGLGARDTLRLEAGYPLYGNELDEETTPLEAKLGFAVDFEEGDFIGKDYLLKQRKRGIERTRVGIEIENDGIPRGGMEIESKGNKIGTLTSGTYSPILETGIGMGYVSPEHAEAGNSVQVKIRNKKAESKVVELPFV